MPRELLDPKNDYVFKRLFADAPDLLMPLINAIREPEPAITRLEVLNPSITAEDITGKAIVLDILAEDENNKRYNIEMQVARVASWSARSLYYLARVLSGQIKSGEDYPQLKHAIGIHLLDFDLFQQPEALNRANWRFEMRDEELPSVVLGYELQVNIIELRKAERLGVYSKALNAWVQFIEHWQNEAELMALDYEPVVKAMSKLKEISADDREWAYALSREKAVRDYHSFINQAKAEGKAEGREEGKALAREEFRQSEAKLLLKLLTRKFGPVSSEYESRVMSASVEQLESWFEQVLDAGSVEALVDDK